MTHFLTNLIRLPWDVFCILFLEDREQRNEEKKKFYEGMRDTLTWNPYWLPGIKFGRLMKSENMRMYWDRTWWLTDKEIDHHFKHKKLR